MNIEHKNHLIAEFLKLRPCQRCSDCGGFYVSPHGENTTSNIWVCTPDQMRYHDNWNWLMSLVEKIESIWHDDHGYFGVFISSNSCTIQGTKFRPDLKKDTPPVYYYSSILNSKIESTYHAVIKFIEWYMTEINE